jgi:hypothetical protein
MKTKGGPQYVVSAIFLMEFGDEKVRTSNPQFFASVRSLAYSRNIYRVRHVDFVLRNTHHG